MAEMRALKSWYVQLEKVNTSAYEYGSYMIDKRRHRGQVIEPLNDIRGLTASLENDKELWHTKMARGGHIPSPSYSLMISFPFILDKDDWIKFNEYILTKFFKYVSSDKLNQLNLTDEEISKMILRTPQVVHKGNHCHYQLPKILHEHNTVLDYSMKRFAINLKMMVNDATTELFGISKYDYMTDFTERKATESQRRWNKQDATDLALDGIIDELERIIDVLEDKQFPTGGLIKSLTTAKTQRAKGNTQRSLSTVKNAMNKINEDDVNRVMPKIISKSSFNAQP